MIKIILAFTVSIAISGCAHPVKVSPDLSKVTRESNTPFPIQAKVRYVAAPELIATEVTTAGGGGDNIRYFPYRELDAGFQRMLSNVFSEVERVESLPTVVSAAGTAVYTIAPVIVTTSGSTGLFTWPPSNFTVDLTSQIRDSSGNLIASPRVVGLGVATDSERRSEFGIAGTRAFTDALVKMQGALLEVNLLGIASGRTLPALSRGSTEERLNRLKQLRDSGAISQTEYEAKRKEILDSL